MKKIKSALLAASGVSDKAARHMLEEDKSKVMLKFIRNFLEPAGKNFVDELVYRFLLTRGDTLGGSMRNIGGMLAQRKLTTAIISALSTSKVYYRFLNKKSRKWSPEMGDNQDITMDVKAISWSHGKVNRTIVYDITVPVVGKNIDICLLNCFHQDLTAASKIAENYLALGELKGGIDPAGADEHWKTANTALSRVRTSFAHKNLSPHLFFIGAVIVNDMAAEIWSQLKSGSLKNAANLTNANQVASLCSWLCSL